MIYKVNFRMTETSEASNVYVWSESEQEAREYVCGTLIPFATGEKPYYSWVEVICKTKK